MTAFRVSTITANGNVAEKGALISLDVFYHNLHIESGKGFVWAKYKDESKGTHPKVRRGREKKSFDNQVTMVYYFQEGYNPNMKLFRNGNIQMTGLKDIDDGPRVIEAVANEILRISKDHPDICSDITKIKPHNFITRMINSDFVVPYKIRRKELYNILISNYENTSCYQPESYPGIKMHFYWNTHNHNKDGICRCKSHCFGKGEGDGDGNCKKVTISIFQSGSILITGATSYAQVVDTYKFINQILHENEKTIRWTAPPLLPIRR